MRTFTTNTAHLHTHRPRAIVLAVGGDSGVADAVAFLTDLPELRCPVVVSADPAVLGEIEVRLGRPAGETCTDDRPLDDAAVWVIPDGHLVGVDRDRWALTPNDAADHEAQVGRLCSSLKTSYRSRVFIVCAGSSLEDNPFVRLLVQRGAPLVETRARVASGLAVHAPVMEIIAHLDHAVGTSRKAIA
jgi:hypothetical protein